MIIDMPAPKPEHLPRLRQIWKEAFGDEDAFLDRFFSVGFSRERCLCALWEDAPVAAIYWFDATVRGQKVAYLYALATAKAYRARGIARRLLEKTHDHLRQQGYQATLLVPGDQNLGRWYQRLDYAYCCEMADFSCNTPGEPIVLRSVTPAEYGALRKAYLPDGSVEQDAVTLEFLATQVQLYAGENFLMACCGTPSGVLTAPEFLGDPAAAPGILAALRYQSGVFQRPGVGKSPVMFRSLSVPGIIPPAYFAFPLD